MMNYKSSTDSSDEDTITSTPLSFVQERFWAFEQIAPGTAVYNVPIALRISGLLDLDIVDEVMSEIVRRHEILRAAYPAADGQPVLVIHRDSALKLARVDAQDVNDPDQLEWARHACEADCRQPFDLTTGPPLQVYCFRTISDHPYKVSFTFHHSIFDGSCVDLLLNEFASLYKSLSEGEPSSLPDLPLQYSDFIDWQRQKLQGKVLERLISFWRKTLEGSSPRLALPADHTPGPIRNYRGSRLPLVLGEGLTESLRAFGSRGESTLFATLLSALAALLYRYTGQEDISIGTPIAGRIQPKTGTLIGSFINMLVLRVKITRDMTFRELLDRVSRTSFQAYYNQELPFQNVVSALNPARDPSSTPLFQVMLSVLAINFPRTPANLPGLTFEFLDVHNGTSKFDLALEFEDRSGEPR